MTYANISKDAQKGDAKARYELALMYHRGVGVPKDLKQAARWYRMAAEQGLVKAQVQLAAMYWHGEGLPVQHDKAVYWYEKAAEQGDAEGQRQLAVMYADGLGVDADFEKSLTWSELSGLANHADLAVSFRERARSSGNGKLMYQLARMLDSARLPGGEDEALEWYQKSADLGHLESMLSLAMRLATKGGDPDNQKRSLEYLMKAKEGGSSEAEWELNVQRLKEDPNLGNLEKVVANAEQGHSRSQYAAAIAQLRGELPTQDRDWAIRMLRSAAERGLPEAQFALGQALMEGSFIDQGEGLRWLYQSARSGHLDSQYLLGICHIVGAPERLQWLESSSRNGHAEAQMSLSDIYIAENRLDAAFDLLRQSAVNGYPEGQYRLAKLLSQQSTSDWNEVSHWLYRSAEANHGGARLRLFEMHSHGIGVEQNMEHAVNWLVLAAEVGMVEAYYRLSRLEDWQLAATNHSINRDEMLERAARGGHAEARFHLAKSKLHEEDGAEASSDALELMQLSAESGYLDAAEWLANYYVGRDRKFDAIRYLEMCCAAGIGDSAFTLAGILSEQLKNSYDPIIEEQIVGCLKMACEKGNAEACFQLAVMTARGEGTGENYSEAFRLFLQAAEAGMKEAQFRVGVMLLSGLGCDDDPSQAEHWLKQAAANGHVEAAVSLAQIYDLSESPEAKSKARDLYQFAASSGHLSAISKLADASPSFESMPQDMGQWSEVLVLNASCGEHLAQTCLRKLLALGPESYTCLDVAVFWYRIGADMRDANAQFWLAECYLLGMGLDTDTEKAQKLYALAANNGNANAQLQLGDSYYFGEGVERDLSRAAELYEEAAAQGNTKAQFNLASMCELGEGRETDIAHAIELYRMAAEADHGFAQLALARLLLETKKPQAESDAVHWLLCAAELGLAEGVFLLGELHRTGSLTIDKHEERAAALFERASEMGHAGAQVVVAKRMLENGGDDVARALILFRSAEQNGSAEAAMHIGMMHIKGLAGQPDYDEAVRCLSRASEAGLAQSQLSLALMYLNGVGVAENPASSAFWMEQAALQGVPEAQYLIGLMYSEGAGKEKDEAAALTWFQEAAHNGHAEACYMLARAYSMGIGLEVDPSSAITWCRKAADQGHKEAVQLLDRLTVS